jgi:hypothetical protein
MKKQEKTTAAIHRKQAYDAPEVEILQAHVEKGFQSSRIVGDATGEGLQETGTGDNSLFT